MEKCKGKSLLQEIKDKTHLCEKQAACICREILLALLYLHNQNICHRDIKADNVILHQENGQTHLKIIDFGIATNFTPAGMTGKEGSSFYMAPEIVGRIDAYSEKCDLWSLGILLYIVFTGYMPFASIFKSNVEKLILAGTIDQRPL